MTSERSLVFLHSITTVHNVVGFTGVDQVYEAPEDADLVIKSGEWSIEECVESAVNLLKVKVCAPSPLPGISVDQLKYNNSI